MEQEHQGYHDHEQSDNSSEEIEDNSEINPKDRHSVLAAHQAQVKWKQLYPFSFYSASSQGWFCKIS